MTAAFVPVRVWTPLDDDAASFLEFAASGLRRARLPRVAVTGTDGKTLTAAMIARVLSRRGGEVVLGASTRPGMGFPPSVFLRAGRLGAAVAEVSSSAVGDVGAYARIFAPTCAVVTRVAPCRLSVFGTHESLRDEILSVSRWIGRGGMLVLNADEPVLGEVRPSARFRISTYGVHRGQIRPDRLRWDEDGCAFFRIGRTAFQLLVPGVQSLYAALAAIAVGIAHRVPKGEIAEALRAFRPQEGLLRLREARGFRLLDDTEGANPATVRQALCTLTRVAASGRRIAVLGDMPDLGADSPRMHRAAGAFAAEMGIDHLVCFGSEALHVAAGAAAAGMDTARVRHFQTPGRLLEHLGSILGEGDLILLKSSRDARLDRVASVLAAFDPIAQREIP